MRHLKLRHKILIGLVLAITVALIGHYIYLIIFYSRPETYIYRISISLKSSLLIYTLLFIPVYLAALLLWFIGVKIADAVNRRK